MAAMGAIAGPEKVSLLDACAASRAEDSGSRCAEDPAFSGARASPRVALHSCNGAPGPLLPNKMLPRCERVVVVVIVQDRRQMANRNAAAAEDDPVLAE